LQLIPMSEVDFLAYQENEIREYAEEKIRSGAWSQEEAYKLSVQTHRRLLPEGTATPGQYIFSIRDEELGQNVGAIWFARYEEGGNAFAFIYDLIIFEQFRRRGYGTQAMLALEEKVKEVGLDTIALHVFAHNQTALALYEKVGYEITDIQMTKTLKAKSSTHHN
jgi:ribosomal protein S18 acetylase RimI-like enzyme